MTKKDKKIGAMMGLLIGDALGVPYEFHVPHDIPPFEEIEYDPPKGFDRAHMNVLPGTWSDDGAQALCLLASLLAWGEFDADDFAKRLLDWQNSGYMAVDNYVYDIGITTHHALDNLKKGMKPLDAGIKSESANGNGSLMRVLPLALWHQGTDEELIRDAKLQSRVTHGHIRAQLCCAYYCLIVREILKGERTVFSNAFYSLQKNISSTEREELVNNIVLFNKFAGTGYVVDCFWSAYQVLNQYDTYEKVVKAAIALGNDTDTTAAVAGGLAGLKFGVDGIPLRWREGLRGWSEIEDLVNKLGEQ